jgi:hypothetical protein
MILYGTESSGLDVGGIKVEFFEVPHKKSWAFRSPQSPSNDVITTMTKKEFFMVLELECVLRIYTCY